MENVVKTDDMKVMNIYEKLAVIQKKISVPKNNENEYGQYKYRSCEDILAAVKPFLEETATVLTLDDEVVLINERYYVKATATLISVADGKLDTITNCGYAREEETKKGMDASQITGSCSSYARKYALAGLLLLDSEKDADARDNRETEEPKAEEKKTEADPKKTKITQTQTEKLIKKLEADAIPVGTVTKLYKVSKLPDLTVYKLHNIYEHWEELKAKATGN